MHRQTVLHAIVTFFSDLRQSTGMCQISMLWGAGACYATGYVLSAYLTAKLNLGAYGAGTAIATGCVALWFLAFAVGVRARPQDERRFLVYPPVMVFGAVIVALPLFLVAGVAMGVLLGESILSGLLWSLAGFVVLNIPTVLLFNASARGTEAGVMREFDPTLMIADAYQRTWSYYGTSLLVCLGLFTWIMGGPTESWATAASLQAAMATSVFAMGFASGYYP